MACQYFGPYDPRNDPPSLLTAWVQSCPSSGGPFPQATLNGRIYNLYCCANPTDLPVAAAKKDEFIVALNPRALRELVKTGRVAVGGGKITVVSSDGPAQARRKNAASKAA